MLCYLRHKATAVSEGFAAVHTVAEQGFDTVAVVAEQAADTEAVPVHLPAEPVLERLLIFAVAKSIVFKLCSAIFTEFHGDSSKIK